MNMYMDEHNLLQELESGFVAKYDTYIFLPSTMAHCSKINRYPRVLEMELDMLSQKLATAPIIAGLPALMRRISQKEMPHGADIIIGLHTRILQLHYANELAQIQARAPNPQPFSYPIADCTRSPTVTIPSLAELAVDISVEGSSDPPDLTNECESTRVIYEEQLPAEATTSSNTTKTKSGDGKKKKKKK